MSEFIIFSLLNTLIYGLLLFMLSSGLTLIFGLMNVLNFAHASFYMIGAYFAYQVSLYIGFIPALFLAPLGVGILGMIVERYGLRKVHAHGHVAELLFTFGLFFLFNEVVILIWGRNPVDYQIPGFLDFPLFTLFGADFSAYKGFMLLISIAMFIGMYLVINRTRIGLVIQASLTHPEMVSVLGHNVPAVFMYVFGAGAALAGLAGVIGGNFLVTEPGMAMALGPIVFVVIVVGGMGSLTGAFISSLLLAGLQTFAVGMNYSLADFLGHFGIQAASEGFWGDIVRIEIANTRAMIPFLFMIFMLIFRPKGLMGVREE
ncbi:branched-chain amino acid ABC transporter permease [Desulfatibacillum aliphaticivorans]|uniref:Inner-membrane translocator n=1 Tax=Desulfatibacillum aliphaticivorans TaxID=218208 RepID=B8FJ40_DESAL|nr:branched-chain amino acid ABC transporter permease [Desulfatibacillum aliphaticivorans]ACL04967.1 inner-membrane translocator [Desulfatibacillum aliphaticivorans]